MTALRDRCKAFLEQQMANGIMRVGSPVDDLMAFVIAETGRTGSPSLDTTLPLCLYFATEEEREEFIAAIQQANPGMMTKRMP